MSDFYTELAAVATEMLAEFGTDFVLQSQAEGGEYDPVTGETASGGDPINTPFKGVRMNPTQEYAQSMSQGTVHARDMLILMEPNAREPKLEDAVVMGDETWQVVNIRVEKPADVPLYYLVQVRP